MTKATLFSIWYFDKEGRPAFYREGDNVFRDGKRIYWISGINWYSSPSGQVERTFYESGKWLYDNYGTGHFYRADDPLVDSAENTLS